MDDLIAHGRRCYERRAWADAYDALRRAGDAGTLEIDDVERLAWAAGLSGNNQASLAALERLHNLRHDAGQIEEAALAAFWLGFRLIVIGEPARGSGWLARAKSTIDARGVDSVVSGYLRLPDAQRSAANGELEVAHDKAAEAVAIADRFRDKDLGAYARCLQGRTLLRRGLFDRGLPLLDEAMLAATNGELSPLMTGLIYCMAIAACKQSYALERAREWTEGAHVWCSSQPQLVPFTGVCLVHRSEILLFGGEWPRAFDEACRAAERVEGRPAREVAAAAAYQQAEIHRLRGDLSDADACYARASELGLDPQPGLALLRLAQNRSDAAESAIQRALTTSTEVLERARILPAFVEIMLARLRVDDAATAANELDTIANNLGSEPLRAFAAGARGSVLLESGDAQRAIDPLRRAHQLWERLGAPYESARIRVQLARACEKLGDRDGAHLEREAAKKIFASLGATPELEPRDQAAQHPLSPRELEVLRLVATGKTNKEIAAELSLSERTVDRHVSNIFDKLGVSTRAAATAWVYEHKDVLG